jgi:putative tryptophan/tyrosine transport system substrate-binding protein
MRRREFIVILSFGAAWPLKADAQRLRPVIGLLSSASPERFAHLIVAFREGLQELGYTEGENVVIEYRWANDQAEQLAILAEELARRQVTVIVASGGTAAALAAKAVTSTIPIVFTAAADPVELGLVASLNRPGANLTGSTAFTTFLDPKRLALLKELMPAARVLGVLTNPAKPNAESYWRDLQMTARALGQEIVNVEASSETEFDTAFESVVAKGAGALLVVADPLFNGHRRRLVRLAAQHRIPTLYQDRAFATAGGLISYGASITAAYRQAGIYTGRILKGAAPRDLPVMQPTQFEFVINLKTAIELGLTIPPTLLARADEVIESHPEAQWRDHVTSRRSVSDGLSFSDEQQAIAFEGLGCAAVIAALR